MENVQTSTKQNKENQLASFAGDLGGFSLILGTPAALHVLWIVIAAQAKIIGTHEFGMLGALAHSPGGIVLGLVAAAHAFVGLFLRAASDTDTLKRLWVGLAVGLGPTVVVLFFPAIIGLVAMIFH